MSHVALFYEKKEKEKVKCYLCPHLCVLKPGERGKCDVRMNKDGTLIAENYGLCSAVQIDPIEKKPLYHFCPGSQILSIGSIGCNLKCNFCQNCDISQTSVEQFLRGEYYEPDEIVEMAREFPENLGIAFTYNEPVIYYEFMLDIAPKIKELGMKNVMISNGFVNKEPFDKILPYIDAFNIDLKSFRNSFYRDITGARLRPVKETLKMIRNSGKHLEITNLVIPSLNDGPDDFHRMVKWIRDELGRDTVLHLSRYFPAYKSRIQKTPSSVLFSLAEIARQFLDYVYLGNITGSESQNTICNKCGRMVILRNGYFVQKTGINEHGKCIHCNNKIIEC